MSAVTEAERLARATLTHITEPGDLALAAVVDECGAQAVVQRLREGDDLGRPQAAAWRVRLEGHDPERDLEAAARRGARLVCPGDAEWPEALGDLRHAVSVGPRSGAAAVSGRAGDRVRNGGAPLALWVRGTAPLSRLCASGVAVVGSRAATAYGADTAGDLAYALAGRGVTVVSGAAYGIDGAAHRGALAAEGPTLAVLACGVDVSYPRGHTALLERIAADGAVVSEVPPGTAPSRLRFLVRNRVIAALSCGTVVVEAAVRSGALNTARWAEQLLRPVMAVPGPVTSAMSVGAHQLVRDQVAVLVTDGEEVLEVVSPAGTHLASPRVGETRPRDGLDAATSRVLEAVPATNAIGLERLARAAGLPAEEVQVKLVRLLLLDFVEQVGERWRLGTALRGS